MHSFTDNEGREWHLVVTVNDVRRLRKLLGVDLVEVVTGDLAGQLRSDVVLLCDVIYALCAGQAERAGVTDEEFGRALAGEVIDDATRALLEELADFFPGRRGKALRAMIERIDRLEEMALELTGELEETLEAALRATGAPSSGSPPSAVSTPAPSP